MVLLRVIAMWLTTLLLSRALPSGASAAASPVAQDPAYTYHNAPIPSVTADAAAERGPPDSPDRYSTYDAIDSWSHGASARPDATAAGHTTTYSAPVRLAQVTLAMATTQPTVHADDGGLSSIARVGVAAESADDLLPGLPALAPKPLGLGSTGRTTPQNLTEQLAMTEVRSAPGRRVLSKVTMTDPRWPASDGWVKMQQIIIGKYQANFSYWIGERAGKPFGNCHLDITDMIP